MMPSWQEMLPILILLLVIFGARKLPEIGAGLGKGIKEFKKSVKEIDEEDKKAVEHTSDVKAETKEKTTDKEEV